MTEFSIKAQKKQGRNTYGYGPTTTFETTRHMTGVVLDVLGVTTWHLGQLAGLKGDSAYKWKSGETRPGNQSLVRLIYILSMALAESVDKPTAPINHLRKINWEKDGTLVWRDNSVTSSRHQITPRPTIPGAGADDNAKLSNGSVRPHRQASPLVASESIIPADTFPDMQFVL
jgi:hypothetical protein